MTDERARADEIGNKPEAARDGGQPPAAAAPAAKPATEEKDLQALRDAVVDAASVSAGLWLSYLFVLFYLAIAVYGVTHNDLLVENA